MAHGLEARQPPAFGFQRVDRQGLEIASAGMRRVIAAAADRAPVPGVDDVERQGHMGGNGGMEPFGGGPGAEANAGNRLRRRVPWR